ncbi:MAG: hypothetical protein AAF340_11850 [Pseudomonadota bacterium]
MIQFILPVALTDVFDVIGPQHTAEAGDQFDLAVMLNPEVPGYIAQGHPWSIAASNPVYIDKIISAG